MVNNGWAHLSDVLFGTAIVLYVIALVGYCAEYAFGPRGLRAGTASDEVSADGAGDAAERAAEPVLVGAMAGAAGARGAAGAGGALGAAGAGLDADRGPDGPSGPVTGVGSSPLSPSWRSSRFVLSGALGQWAGRCALLATVVGAVVHVASVTARGISTGRAPWGNMYEFTSAMGLVAVAVFLGAVARTPRARGLGLFVMLPIVVLMFLAGTVLYVKAGPLTASLHSYWLVIHVAAAIIATGVFMVSAVATLLYLLRARYDRQVAAGVTPSRLPVSLGAQLPPASTLDTLAYRSIAFGFPIWTFGIIAGAIWAEAAWSRYWGWDPKETWAFIAWVIYAGYLHARATAGWKGVKAARINLLGFGAMLFNFFIVNIVVSGLHSYAGL